MAVAIGMNTAIFNVVDIDSDNPEIADLIECHAVRYLGATPAVRLRHGSSRRVLVYERDQHTAPISKARFTFKDANGAEHAVEFLARGQQVVIEGPHAKGDMYYWRDGGLIEHREAIGANLITADKVDSFFRAVAEWVEKTEGFERVRLALPSGGNRGVAVKIALNSKHVASDKGMLAKAIRAIDINDQRLADYDTWCALFRAMWAACGGDRQFYYDHILPWLAGNPENTEEEMEAKLDSFKDSQLGYEYVYGIAADFGFMEGLDSIADQLFGGPTDPAPARPGDQGDTRNDTGIAPLPAQPSGPIPPSDTHWQLAAAFIEQHGANWRYNVDARSWCAFNGLVWELCDCMPDVVGRMLAELGVRIYQTVAGPAAERRFRALQSFGTINSVVRLMQGLPQMVVRDVDFDSHPHLLNTPDGVIDLRTGELQSHNSSLLIRKITLVSPDFRALVNYERLCPRFFDVLRNVAADRSWVIPAIRAWFAYCLTGALKHQALLFLHGPPGVGKTLIIQVLFDLLHTYSFLLDESFFSKNGGDAKRFDMANIVGKRLLFMDETQLGMTWDETRASKGASSAEPFSSTTRPRSASSATTNPTSSHRRRAV
jgi:hypothetical protein